MIKSSKKKGEVLKAKKIKVKSHTRRISSKSKTPPKIIKKTPVEKKIDKALINNFIALQKIMVNFSAKFDNLSNQISKLLELFEISAKSLARKDFEEDKENKDIKKILEKLDNVSQQAGLIGKGLALIHEVTSEKEPPIMSTQRQRPPIPPSKPAFGMGGYQKSIASKDSGPRISESMTKEISE